MYRSSARCSNRKNATCRQPKRLLLRASVASLLLCSAACAAASDAAPKTITVSLRAAIGSNETVVVSQAAAAFNATQRKYKVELVWSHYRNYEQWVRNVSLTGTMPCLLELDGPVLAEFAWLGYLQPLDPFISAEMRRDLLPSIVAQGTYNGHLYSLGQFDSGLGLWANRRHLATAGVRIPTVAEPWTLAEFEQAMDRLARVKGVEYPLNLALYTGTSEFYAYAYLPILVGFGGDYIDRKDYQRASGVLDGPRSVEAMKRFQSWFREGWVRAVMDRNDDFEKGRNALLWTGHWKYADLRATLGADLVLLPLPDFGRGLKTALGSWAWSISSTCPEPQGAWAFLSHLISVREILRMTKANGAVPARISALAQSPLYGAGGALRVYAQQLSSGAGVPRPTTPGYSTISRVFSNAVTGIIAGGDVQVELTRAARAIDADIATHGGYSQ